MAVSALDRVLISTGSLKESLAFYRDWVGLEVAAEGYRITADINALWRTRADAARFALLAMKGHHTLVELVEFSSGSKEFIRDGGNATDYGTYDIAFSVQDIEGIYQELTRRRYSFVSQPQEYQPPWLPVTVKETILIGPDNVHIAHLERMTPDRQKGPKYLRFLDTAQVVASTDEALRFYCGTLGLKAQQPVTLPRGPVSRVLGLPADSDVKLTFSGDPAGRSVMVEFLESSARGKPLAGRSRPPNRGIFALSFEVDNLSSTLADCARARVEILSKPLETTIPDRGKATAATVIGPSGVMVELFEKKSV